MPIPQLGSNCIISKYFVYTDGHKSILRVFTILYIGKKISNLRKNKNFINTYKKKIVLI